MTTLSMAFIFEGSQRMITIDGEGDVFNNAFLIYWQLLRRMPIIEIIIENETRMDTITFGEYEKYYESMYKDR